jgi:hypothetical protein
MERPICSSKFKLFDVDFNTLIKLVIIIAGIFFLANAVVYYTVKNPSRINDLLNYKTGASIVYSNETNKIYNRETQIKHQQATAKPISFDGLLAFRTAPTTAVLYIPFLFIKSPLDIYLFAFINCAILGAIIYLCSKFTGKKPRDYLTVLALLPFFYPLFDLLINFQLGLLITSVVMLSAYFINNKGYALAGITASILFLKPVMLPVCIALIVFTWAEKNMKALIKFTNALAISLGGIVLINTYLYGLNFLSDYINFIFASESSDFGTKLVTNFNLTLILQTFIKDPATLKYVAVLLGLAALTTLTWIASNKINEKNKWTIFSVMVGIIPFINLHTMPNDLVILIIPLLLVPMSLVSNVFVMFAPFLAFFNMHWVFVVGSMGILGKFLKD